jgi:hypothetical protein
VIKPKVPFLTAFGDADSGEHEGKAGQTGGQTRREIGVEQKALHNPWAESA